MSWLVRLRFRRILFLSGLIAGAILNYIANPTEEDRKPIIQPVSLERFVIAGAFRGACTQNLAKRQFSSGAWYPVWALRRPPRRRRYKAWERMHERSRCLRSGPLEPSLHDRHTCVVAAAGAATSVLSKLASLLLCCLSDDKRVAPPPSI